MEVVKLNFLKFRWGQENSLCRGTWAKAHRQEMTIEFWRMAHKSVRLKNKMQGSVSIRIKRYGKDKAWKALSDRLKILDHSWCLWWEREVLGSISRQVQRKLNQGKASVITQGQWLKDSRLHYRFPFFPYLFLPNVFFSFQHHNQ